MAYTVDCMLGRANERPEKYLKGEELCLLLLLWKVVTKLGYKTEVLVLPLDVSRRSFGISVKISARDSPCYRPRGLEAAVPEIVRVFAGHDIGTTT